MVVSPDLRNELVQIAEVNARRVVVEGVDDEFRDGGKEWVHQILVQNGKPCKSENDPSEGKKKRKRDRIHHNKSLR